MYLQVDHFFTFGVTRDGVPDELGLSLRIHQYSLQDEVQVRNSRDVHMGTGALVIS